MSSFKDTLDAAVAANEKYLEEKYGLNLEMSQSPNSLTYKLLAWKSGFPSSGVLFTAVELKSAASLTEFITSLIQTLEMNWLHEVEKWGLMHTIQVQEKEPTKTYDIGKGALVSKAKKWVDVPTPKSVAELYGDADAEPVFTPEQVKEAQGTGEHSPSGSLGKSLASAWLEAIEDKDDPFFNTMEAKKSVPYKYISWGDDFYDVAKGEKVEKPKESPLVSKPEDFTYADFEKVYKDSIK